MPLVQETTAGGVTVRIHDDYCRDMSEEAGRKILERIAARAMADLNATGQNTDKLCR